MRRLCLAVGMLAVAQLCCGQEAQTRVYTAKSCPVTSSQKPADGVNAFAPVVAALVSAAIAPLVEAAVNRTTALVTEAAKAKDQTLDPPITIQRKFYAVGSAGDIRMNPAIACIVVVRGKFTALPKQSILLNADPVLARIMSRFKIHDAPAEEPGGDILLADEPEFYFETSVVLGDDRKTIAFQPRAIYVGRFALKNGLFGPSQRTYKVALTFTDWATNQPFASSEFEFNGVQEGVGVQDCVDKPIDRNCNGERLGGLHGWYATKPATDATQAEANRRANIALSLATVVNTTPVDPPVPTPEEMPGTERALKLYCAELDKANKPRPDAKKLYGDVCPAELVQAKRVYLQAKLEDKRTIDRAGASSLWAKHCASGHYPKTQNGAAQCLDEALYNKQSALFSGDFLISSAIVEQRAGNKVAEFFAPAVTAVAPKLKETLISELDPVARQQKEEQKAQASAVAAKLSRQTIVTAQEAKLAVDVAQADYDQALLNLGQNPADATLRIAVIQKQSVLLQKKADANEAALVAGQPAPFDDIY